tara:strand:- start:1514 stop:2821 length:1308 start_codon:yes stop_codon:yes gene_type:complete
MSPQITLQTPIQLPPNEIPSYLNQLWSKEQQANSGANTFSLIIWQPAWLEQQLIRTGLLNGPIIGNEYQALLDASKQVILREKLPISTALLDERIINCLKEKSGNNYITDLRGQDIAAEISALKPRRLITLAPSIEGDTSLEALVAAYCPLLEEGGSNSACGDTVVLRGGLNALNKGLEILNELIPNELPSWLWWNGSLNEANELFTELASSQRRLIIDTAIGDPSNCLALLQARINTGQAVNDLNWLRLRSWRESIASVFDPPERRISLENILKVDIDVKGSNPVQGLLLLAWIADRLEWKLINSILNKEEIISADFQRKDKSLVKFKLTPLPVGNPSNHPGQIVGVRLICKADENPQNSLCVILASESSECMRLEAGGMASMDLVEEVVPNQKDSLEKDVSRLLRSSRGSTSPLLSSATPIANHILYLAKNNS